MSTARLWQEGDGLNPLLAPSLLLQSIFNSSSHSHFCVGDKWIRLVISLVGLLCKNICPSSTQKKKYIQLRRCRGGWRMSWRDKTKNRKKSIKDLWKNGFVIFIDRQGNCFLWWPEAWTLHSDQTQKLLFVFVPFYLFFLSLNHHLLSAQVNYMVLSQHGKKTKTQNKKQACP